MASVLAVIGGSGLYDVEALEDPEEIRVSTPFGDPSDAVMRGRFKGTDTIGLFLPTSRSVLILAGKLRSTASLYCEPHCLAQANCTATAG